MDSIRSGSVPASEAAKVVIVLYTAHVATIRAARIGDPKILLKAVAFPMAVVTLIAVENLSTGIICAAMVAVIVFVTSPKFKQFFAIGGVLVGFMLIFLFTQRYRLDRIRIWLNPEKYEKDIRHYRLCMRSVPVESLVRDWDRVYRNWDLFRSRIMI